MLPNEFPYMIIIIKTYMVEHDLISLTKIHLESIRKLNDLPLILFVY